MTPIIKNTRVVDEHGNEYEATYPKRAKGLVKSGRARFVDYNCICLVRSPNNDLEDDYMKTNEDKSTEINDEINRVLQQSPNADVGEIVRNAINEDIEEPNKQFEKLAAEEDTKANQYDDHAATIEAKLQLDDVKRESTLNIDYVLARIDQVLNETDYIKSTLSALVDISVAGPGDIANAQRAEALGNIVKCRETTNQKLLALYEMMYDDIKTEQKSFQEKELEILQCVMSNPTLSFEEKELTVSTLDEIRNLKPLQTSLEKNISSILSIAKSIDWTAYPPQVQLDISEAIKAQLSRQY